MLVIEFATCLLCLMLVQLKSAHGVLHGRVDQSPSGCPFLPAGKTHLNAPENTSLRCLRVAFELVFCTYQIGICIFRGFQNLLDDNTSRQFPDDTAQLIEKPSLMQTSASIDTLS